MTRGEIELDTQAACGKPKPPLAQLSLEALSLFLDGEPKSLHHLAASLSFNLLLESDLELRAKK